MVLTWMMMPRTGGRDFNDTRKIIQQIFDRNLAAWDEDHRTFTDSKKKIVKRKAPRKKLAKKAAAKRPAKKLATKVRKQPRR
jgi:hypothetical protein